jgi:phosphoribosyl 1,2-cyclic phosphodiesterase
MTKTKVISVDTHGGGMDEALAMADRIGAQHTWLTHLSHTFPRYATFREDLRRLCRERGIRSDVQPAYDGLVIE